MDCIHIPAALFETLEYRRLTVGDREMLISLYAKYGDCDTFTVDLEQTEQFGLRQWSNLAPKIRRILEAGLLKVVGKTEGVGKPQRVFAFAHPVAEAYQ